MPHKLDFPSKRDQYLSTLVPTPTTLRFSGYDPTRDAQCRKQPYRRPKKLTCPEQPLAVVCEEFQLPET
jgi:hypothetical protein